MRAAGLLPLLPLLLLLLGVKSQDDAGPGQATNTTTTGTATTGTTPTTTTPASTTNSSLTTAAPSSVAAQTTSTATAEGRPTQTTTAAAAQSIPSITTDPGTSSSTITTPPTTVTGMSPATSGTASAAATTTSTHASGQDSPSHSATTPKTSPAASTTASQPPSSATASLGISGNTTAAQPVRTDAIGPPGAVGTAATSSPSTQPQGKQPLDHLPNTTVSATVPRTDPSQSSKDCVVSPPPCATKQPPSSSSSPVQGPIPSTSPGSTGMSVTPPIGSPSVATTPTSQAGSKDTVPEAATRTAPGAGQSTHDVGPTSAKPTRASQRPASAQTSAPALREQTDSYSPGHQHPNISFPNELICKDRVQHTGPTICLKEPKTCDEWKAASNISLFESFCSTAQHVFDTSRDTCMVTLTAHERQSHCWAVWVVLHHPLDSEEVFKGLKEKKEKLEELGIVNITSDKMVEDMTINDEFSTPLIITIITLAASLLLIAAIYGCHQRFSQKKDQNIHPDVPGFDDGHVALIFNRLTEEMQTMENGYHDNPTLEVMETSSEMQEKKVNLNGELGDSWIVPLDTLMKEDLEEEEDTHL